MTIDPRSLVGFALVFFAATWMASIAFAMLLRAARAPLRRAGPRAERRAAAVALITPIAIGVAFAGALAGLSLFGPALGIADHCAIHSHHLHLCLRHGGGWLAIAPIAAPTAMIAGLIAVRLARIAARFVAADGRLRALRIHSVPRLLDDGTLVQCAPSPLPYCFTAGIVSPSIYVGSTAFDQLDDAQRRAIIAHERAHIRFGDLWRRPLFAVAQLFAAPGVGAYAFAYWRQASERLCDRAAAIEIGSPTPVAQAILAFARQPSSSLGCAFVPGADQVADRVTSLLGDPSIGEGAARRIALAAAAAFSAVAIASIALVDPIHHAIETLLGSL